MLAEGRWQYSVALPDRIVSVFEHILAPDFEPGDSVMYQSPEGTNLPATVVQTDASHWCASPFDSRTLALLAAD